MIIFKNQQYWAQWCAFKKSPADMTSTRVFFKNLIHEIIWKFSVIRIQDQAIPITNFMSFEVQFYIDS